MTENYFAKVCRSSKDKFESEFEMKQRKLNKHLPSDTVQQFSQRNGASATYSEDICFQTLTSFSLTRAKSLVCVVG